MSALYKLTNGNSILKLVSGIYAIAIPSDGNNKDYQDYQEWLAAGNTPDAADPGPETIVYSNLQLSTDLLHSKTLDALVALNSDVTKARWDAATEIAIDDADVIAVDSDRTDNNSFILNNKRGTRNENSLHSPQSSYCNVPH